MVSRPALIRAGEASAIQRFVNPGFCFEKVGVKADQDSRVSSDYRPMSEYSKSLARAGGFTAAYMRDGSWSRE